MTDDQPHHEKVSPMTGQCPDNFGLWWDRASSDRRKCDSCEAIIPAGATYLTGIESCCGGCSRSLCRDCVAWLPHLDLPATEDTP